MKYFFTILLFISLPAMTVSAQTSFRQLGSTADSLNAPRFEFMNGNRHDFGEVPDDGRPLEHEFYFRNAGRTPILVTAVMGSAGNMMAEWPKEPIGPGKRGKIKVFITYPKGNGSNSFNKYYQVHSNATGNGEAQMLFIKGHIVAAGVKR